MLDTSLQEQLEKQGKDDLRNYIAERLGGDYAHFMQLPETDGDPQDYELAIYTLKHIFRVLQKAGVKLTDTKN